MRDRDCVSFLQWALPRLGMRWPGFRRVRRQVCRRIARRLTDLEVEDLAAYRDRLETDAAEWQTLDLLCRVTISRFFRDRAVFEALGRVVLPRLAERAGAAGRTRLTAWSAGCASGEEPYSVAILWTLGVAPTAPGLTLEIVATDTDPHLLERARRGHYTAGSIREVPGDWRERAFEEREGAFRLRPAFRSAVRLGQEDLRRDAPPGPFDLVLCRNLALTYYAGDLQRRVLARIASVLRPGGALVIGGHERLPGDLPDLDSWPGAACCYLYRDR